MATRLTSALLGPELVITTARSSGPGGQNVNKVNSKVTLHFDIAKSSVLTDEEKEIILNKLSSRITTEGILVIQEQSSRSQQDNRELVRIKLDLLLKRAFQLNKKRKPTKPSKASKDKRIQKKKQISEKKQWRRGL